MMTLNNLAVFKLCARTLTVTLLTGVGILQASAQTDTKWAGGTGSGLSWAADINWTKSPPDQATYRAVFDTTGTVEIDVPVESATNGLYVDGGSGGSNVILNIASSSSEPAFSINSALWVGRSAAGPAHLTLTGGGTVEIQQFLVGAQAATAGGNVFRITGGTTVQSSAVPISRLGRFGNGNQLIVDEGSSLTFGSLTLGFVEKGVGSKENGFTISGAGSQATLLVTGTNRGLRIGSNGNTATSYETAQSGNFVAVKDGARLTVSGSNNLINVGSTNFSHSNSLLVEGSDEEGVGSLLHLDNVGGDAITIGDGAESNLGGNFIEVRDGGKLLSTGSGRLLVYGHTAAENSVENRFTIGPDGSVDLSGEVIISNALLQLDGAGELTASAITIQNGARFEAGGSGLHTTGAGATRIEAGGTLAVGNPLSHEAEILSLSSTVSLDKDSILELMIFSNHTLSQVELMEDGGLIIDPEATLRILFDDDYAPSSGDSWTLFLGLTGNISGMFDPQAMDLPTLEGALEWDLSRFNEEGGWRVAVIPEPRASALLLLTCGALLLRKRQSLRAGDRA